MPEDDLEYFARRAQEERQRASLSGDRAAASTHTDMAAHYDHRLIELRQQLDLNRKTLRLPILRT